ncbi:MAG: DUF4435 domain-containing protein [bacterium]
MSFPVNHLFYRTAGEIIAEIKLMLSVGHGSIFLLVEGPTDSIFWTHHINDTICKIVICGEKSTVINTINETNKQNTYKIIGFIDNDFDSIINTTVPINIIATDTHDLETLLLSSKAFDKILATIVENSKIKALEIKEGMGVRDVLINRASIFGKLRLLNTINNYGVNFQDDFHVERFVRSDLTLDEANVCKIFAEEVCKSTIDIQTELNNLPVCKNIWNLIQGHDCIAILHLIFTKIFNVSKCSKEIIFNYLILSFNKQMLQDTNMYLKITNWEEANSCNILI